MRHLLVTLLLLSPLAATLSQADDHQAVPPGPRTCFWARGPVSADPYINLAYPDANVYYWAAAFTTPPGARLELEGQFARSRYQSLISYDQRGRPVETLADYLIEPEPGHTNPYRHGANRTASARSFRVEVSPEQVLDRRGEGERLSGARVNRIRAPMPSGSQVLLYRVYLPDAGTAPTGNAPLPAPVLTLADGSRVTGQAACDALDSAQMLRLDPGALGISVARYRELISQPGRPDTWPATSPPTWHIQLDRKALIGIYTGETSEGVRRSTGGFFPNPDNNYIRTVVNTRLGKVLLLRGKLPRTPQTVAGDATANNEAQLRYWSICSNQSFANTRVNDCLYDEELPLDANGFYTIVVSKAADRPRNAQTACGIAWLPVADDGDGVQDPDVAIVQIRNMLAAPDFEQAVQRVEANGMARSVMGPYLPQANYTMPNAVEALSPCPLD